MQWLPADFVRLADRLRGEFRRGGLKERVGARRLQRYDLRVDGRRGEVVGFFLDDHRLRLASKFGLEGGKISLTEFVILEQDRQFGIRPSVEDVARRDAALNRLRRVK